MNTTISQKLVTDCEYVDLRTENNRHACYLMLPAYYALTDDDCDSNPAEADIISNLKTQPNAEACINVAAQHLLNKALIAAAAAYRWTAKTYPRYEGVCLGQLGVIHTLQNDLDAALRFYKQAWLCGENQTVLRQNIQYTKHLLAKQQRGRITTNS